MGDPVPGFRDFGFNRAAPLAGVHAGAEGNNVHSRSNKIMRQGQQNKRMRGRGRKPTSSLNRVFESNGPDVKIRGPASHIAEKYLNLARDAQSSGDPISAENYLQHAEHYFRIISAQAQPQQPSFPQPNQPQPVFDQPGGEFNGAAPAQAGGSAPAAPAQAGDSAPAPTAQTEAENGAPARPESGGDERTEAAAEDAPRKPRRRRTADTREQQGNAHEAAREPQAAEKSAREDDVPAAAEDAEPGAEKTAEPAA
jgi:hypothetical protein